MLRFGCTVAIFSRTSLTNLEAGLTPGEDQETAMPHPGCYIHSEIDQAPSWGRTVLGSWQAVQAGRLWASGLVLPSFLKSVYIDSLGHGTGAWLQLPWLGVVCLHSMVSVLLGWVLTVHKSVSPCRAETVLP